MIRTLPLALLAVLLLAACRPAADAPAPVEAPSEARSASHEVAEGDLPLMTVYKSENCGCCVVWAERMEEAGFTVRQVNVPNMNDVRQRLGVPPQMGSCHTAVVGDYVVEGHTPAEDVKRMLAERPDAVGIAVPGMPIGSPGMEVVGRDPQPYDVMLFTREGGATVYASH